MKIMVGYNGGAVGRRALSIAREYAKTFNAFVYIITSMEGGTSEKRADIEKALFHELREYQALNIRESVHYKAIEAFLGKKGLARGDLPADSRPLFEYWHDCIKEIYTISFEDYSKQYLNALAEIEFNRLKQEARQDIKYITTDLASPIATVISEAFSTLPGVKTSKKLIEKAVLNNLYGPILSMSLDSAKPDLISRIMNAIGLGGKKSGVFDKLESEEALQQKGLDFSAGYKSDAVIYLSNSEVEHYFGKERAEKSRKLGERFAIRFLDKDKDSKLLKSWKSDFDADTEWKNMWQENIRLLEEHKFPNVQWFGSFPHFELTEAMNIGFVSIRNGKEKLQTWYGFEFHEGKYGKKDLFMVSMENYYRNISLGSKNYKAELSGVPALLFDYTIKWYSEIFNPAGRKGKIYFEAYSPGSKAFAAKQNTVRMGKFRGIGEKEMGNVGYS